MGAKRLAQLFFLRKNMSTHNSQGILLHLFLLILLASLHVISPAVVPAMEISAVAVQTENSEIIVSTALRPDPKFLRELSDGLSKELIIYIDLFRVWKVWPNEFLQGVRLTRIIRSDPIKREYVVTQIEGSRRNEMRFADIGTLTEWAMKVSGLKVSRTENLEEGTYFIKITVESQIKKLPPVVGYFLFFIPEKEFSVSKNSPFFQIRGPSQ